MSDVKNTPNTPRTSLESAIKVISELVVTPKQAAELIKWNTGSTNSKREGQAISESLLRTWLKNEGDKPTPPAILAALESAKVDRSESFVSLLGDGVYLWRASVPAIQAAFDAYNQGKESKRTHTTQQRKISKDVINLLESVPAFRDQLPLNWSELNLDSKRAKLFAISGKRDEAEFITMAWGAFTAAQNAAKLAAGDLINTKPAQPATNPK